MKLTTSALLLSWATSAVAVGPPAFPFPPKKADKVPHVPYVTLGYHDADLEHAAPCLASPHQINQPADRPRPFILQEGRANRPAPEAEFDDDMGMFTESGE